MNHWNREAQRLLRGLLARRGVRRKTLVRELARVGVMTTEAAIANRLYRGTPSFAFVLQIAAALNATRVELRTKAEDEPAQSSLELVALSMDPAASGESSKS